MNLTEKLRTATKEHHAQLDQMPSMKRVTSDAVVLEDYRNYLCAFFNIHAAIEDTIYQNCSRFLKGVNSNRRLKHLTNDLNQLDAVCKTSSTKRNIDLKGLEAIGALYVVEGSRLGGKYIAKHLSNKLALKNNELTFLNATPDLKWSEIISFLNEQPVENHVGIIAGAKHTFQYFYDELFAFYNELE